MTISRFRTILFTVAAIVSLAGVADATYLTVQAFVLHAYCRYCLFSAAITFLLAGLVIAAPSSQQQ